MAAAAPTKIGTGAGKSAVESKGVVLKQPANEVVFAVVGHIGSGTSEIAKALKGLLSAATGGSFDVEILKARDAIRAWAVSQGLQTPKTGDDDLATVEALQDLGDKMRFDTKDNAAVAKALILEIRQTRARKDRSRGSR
jgi:energy-coupling factor transporter ATP-binding protein EcfA2